MNLTIDIGNSRIKIDLFQEEAIYWSNIYDKLSKEALNDIFELGAISRVIVSSVRGHDAALLSLLSSYCGSVMELSHLTPLPIELGYKTPESLGKDRIAAIVGAWSIKPNENSLVIDIGTCITYDLITNDGKFVGGNITPGWRMRLQAMHHFTHTLPALEPASPISELGRSTQEAMTNGAYYGILGEMELLINKLKLKHQGLNIFLTGGDAIHFEKQIKNCIFAIKNLVPIGLNQILRYNEIEHKANP